MAPKDPFDADKTDIGSELDLDEMMGDAPRPSGLKLDFDELLEDEGPGDDAPPPPGARRKKGAVAAPARRGGGGSLDATGFLSRKDQEALDRAKREAASEHAAMLQTTMLAAENIVEVRGSWAPILRLGGIGLGFLLVLGALTYGGIWLSQREKAAQLSALESAREVLRKAEEERMGRVRGAAGKGTGVEAAPTPTASPVVPPAPAPAPDAAVAP